MSSKIKPPTARRANSARPTTRRTKQAADKPPARTRRTATGTGAGNVHAPETAAAPLADAEEPTAAATLEEEIKMLRKITKRVSQLMEKASPEQLVPLLDKLGAANIRVASLLKTQNMLVGKQGGLAEMLDKALEELEGKAEGGRLREEG